MNATSIADAISELTRFAPSPGSMKENYALERMRSFLEKIGNPQDQYRVVHIAGTSGKTSTAYFTRALLCEAGRHVGLTISPHITAVNERVQIDAGPLDDETLVRHIHNFLRIIDNSGCQLTYFEALTGLAFWVFAQQKVDYAVVETGIGGLLDATNAVSRADKVCVITDIGVDHTEVLGDTIEEIATQKAGIILPRSHVLLANQEPRAVSTVLARARHLSASLSLVDSGATGRAVIDLPLYQHRNWTLARATFDFIAGRDGLPALTEKCLRRAMTRQPPGRYERYYLDGKTLILDGAHNPQKIAALCEAMRAAGEWPAAVLASFASAPDPKLTSSLAELRELTTHLIVSAFAVVQDRAKQSRPAHEIAARANEVGFQSVEIHESTDQAFEALLSRPERILVVTGSLYLVSQVRILAERYIGRS
jgi:dihydrofolate synthase / folylpolyglutamate synthase